MPEFIIHSFVHGLEEGAMSIPVLFLAYLFMEILERNASPWPYFNFQ